MSNLPENFELELDAALTRMGLAKRERMATWEGVPEAIKSAIPREVAVEMSEGRMPGRGFGLGADIGAGKTMALAAVVKGCARKAFLMAAEKPSITGWVPQGSPILWLSWPDFVAFLRANATSEASERKIRSACNVPLLVLDDLGCERTKGSYSEDWATSQLHRILSERSREILPVLWTTNVTAKVLVDLYGGATVDRLLQDSPMVWIPGMKSLRLEANR